MRTTIDIVQELLIKQQLQLQDIDLFLVANLISIYIMGTLYLLTRIGMIEVKEFRKEV